MLFLCYPKCSTCLKAKKHLDDLIVKYIYRDIVLDNPNEKELNKWIKESNIDVNKFFNTTGLVYRELKLASKMEELSYKEKIKLLSSNGKLIKRPLIIKDNGEVLIGYKKDSYEALKK